MNTHFQTSCTAFQTGNFCVPKPKTKYEPAKNFRKKFEVREFRKTFKNETVKPNYERHRRQQMGY